MPLNSIWLVINVTWLNAHKCVLFTSHTKVTQPLFSNDPTAGSPRSSLQHVHGLQHHLSSVAQHSTCLCQMPCPAFLLSSHHPAEQMDCLLGAMSPVLFLSRWTPAILNLIRTTKSCKFSAQPQLSGCHWQGDCERPSRLAIPSNPAPRHHNCLIYSSVSQTEGCDSYHRQ